jgi:hypothetical protein
MPKGRTFSGQRGIRIALRTVHIGGAAMLLGAISFGGDPGRWPWALLLSGLLIMADDLFKYGLAWLRWMNFWVLAFKVAFLAAGIFRPDLLKWALWTALILGSLISHAPGSIRHRALWGKRGPCAMPRAVDENP